MATTGQIRVLDSVQGSSFLASRAAMEVFKDHAPDVEAGRIELIRERDSEYVVFTDRRKQLGVRSGTTVELTSHELKVLASDPSRTSVVDKLQGSSFLAIQAAMEIFQRHKPDLVQYRIEVVRDGDFLVVLYTDKDRPVGARGGGGRPGFEVALDPRDRHVVRSNFIR